MNPKYIKAGICVVLPLLTVLLNPLALATVQNLLLAAKE